MLRQKIGSARQLTLGGWSILLQAWLWLLLFDVALRMLGFARVRQVFSPPAAAIPMAPLSHAQKRLIVQACCLVNVAARHHLYPMLCLPRALTLQRLLAGRGVGAELRIGVRKEEGKLAAHAWLEREGQAIGEVSDIETRFAPLVSREVGG